MQCVQQDIVPIFFFFKEKSMNAICYQYLVNNHIFFFSSFSHFSEDFGILQSLIFQLRYFFVFWQNKEFPYTGMYLQMFPFILETYAYNQFKSFLYQTHKIEFWNQDMWLVKNL